ncbi:MAG: hypothetical protein KF894_26865 [Labilithrix sp.]|nr:hypothetical protein [Labilithrix sp.]
MPRPSPPRVTLLAGPPLAIGLAACGPSFQAIYEGNARFEHCYALEENPQESMPEKAACWRDWSERYTYGQTRDRVHYATARYVALSQAPTLPTDEALMMAAPGEAPRLSTITAPAPTNAFAPPPKTLEPEEHVSAAAHGEAARIPVIGADAGGALPVQAPALPAAGCADTCGSNYRGCSGGCDDAEGQKAAKSCQACLKTYRTCMRDCFK